MARGVPNGERGEPSPDSGSPRAADGSTFDEVLQDAGFLQKFCERYMGDPSRAEDIVQETFLRALKHLHRLERRESYAPWLAAVARGRALNELRKHQRIDLVDEVPDRPVPPEAEPAEAVVGDETFEETVSAFTALNARERRLLTRQVEEGLTLAELAEEERSTPSSVKSVLNRARAKLRAALEEGEAWVVAPAFTFGAWLRRHLQSVASRSQQTAPALPGGIERVGEVVTAAVATFLLGSATAPATSAPIEVADGGRTDHVADIRPDPLVRVVPDSPSDAPVPSADVAAVEPTVAGPGESAGPRPAQVDPAPPPSDDEGPGALPDPEQPVSPPPVDREGGEPEALPRDEGDEPEGVFFRDIVWAGGESSSGRHVFALGEIRHRCDADCMIVFHSGDGGAIWERMAAEGLDGEAYQLMVAPGYPDDPRLYAMGATGLQRSLDGGRTFHAVKAPQSGPAAMAPGFSAGDERILIGLGSGWAYDASADAGTPFSPGSFSTTHINFAFAPDHDETGVVYAGHYVHGRDGARAPAVTRCVDDVCDHRVLLPPYIRQPSVYVPALASGDRVVLAWDGNALFRSGDSGETYERVSLDIPGIIASVTGDEAGNLYLGWWHQDGVTRTGGVFRSTDGGRTWVPVGQGSGLERGVLDVGVSPHGVVLAALWGTPDGGLRCSADRGVTWRSRCPSGT